jgi:hypothetical protein
VHEVYQSTLLEKIRLFLECFFSNPAHSHIIYFAAGLQQWSIAIPGARLGNKQDSSSLAFCCCGCQ